MKLKNIIRKVLLESYDDGGEEELTLYRALRKYIKGDIGDYELTGFDDMMKSVSHRSGHLGQASIIFDFDNNEKLFEMLELPEDDGWFARAVTSEHGDGWDFIDYYQSEEDFKEGYTIFGELDDDNVEKMEDIILFLTGKKTNIRDNETEENGKIADLLITSFPDEIDDIIREYRYERNDEMNRAAKESIISELDTFLKNIGFNLHRDYDLISTTPGNLLMWYSRTNRKELNFEELFKLIIEQTNTSDLGGWYEDTYQFHNSDYFDKTGFNREVERQLDKILEKIESEDINFEEFKNLINTVTKKYSIGKWYDLPKNKKYNFKIEGFDIQNMKIKMVARSKKSWRAKSMLLSLESFNNLLYTPELFDLSDVIPESIKEYFDPLHFLKNKFSKKDDREPAGGLELVHKHGDEFQKVVDLIFKKAIKEYPIEHLKGLKVTSVWPQQLVSNDMRGENKIRWNVRLVPVVPDWFNYEKNLGFINNCIKFDEVFRKYSRYMGIESSPPASVKGNPNYVENPDELHNYISFDLVVKKFVTF